MDRAPEREEAGSPNLTGAVALHAAIDTLTAIGWPALIGHERGVAAALRRGLAAIPGVRLLGPGPDAETLPVATFTIDGVPHALAAARLAAEDAIGVRHGCFCAHPYLMRLLGFTREDVRRYQDQVRRGDRSAMPAPSGQARASTPPDRTWPACFVAQLFAGTLPVSAMRAYLVQDYQFVDSFVALMGAAVAVADTTRARMVIARQLGLVAGEENTYFRRSFDALGVPDDEREHPVLLPPTAFFIALMKEAAGTRDYAACLAVLTVAEWLYLDWAGRAPDPLPADPIAREWIELHDNPPFAAWVTFLRAELDRLVPALTPEACDRCARFFAEAARLERAFFDAAHTMG